MGYSRVREAVQALDHDMGPDGILTPAGILENHWNGTLLTSIDTAMRWRGVAPMVHLLDKTYESGVKLTKKAFRPIAKRLQPSDRPG